MGLYDMWLRTGFGCANAMYSADPKDYLQPIQLFLMLYLPALFNLLILLFLGGSGVIHEIPIQNVQSYF